MGIGGEFIEKTKYRNMDRPDQVMGVPQPPLELKYDGLGEIIDLPDPENVRIKDVSLMEAIQNRNSVRNYSAGPISLGELSYLLWSTQGVKRVIPDTATFRTVPSAGARHALETYLLINRVEGLKPGIYRFRPIEHSLIQLNTDLDIQENISRACLGQQFIKSSAVTFIWTAVSSRMTWRYGERGYRYLHLDAGHVCQNLYLSAQSINCGVCAIGAFMDDDLNHILGIDGEDHFVIYLATLGKK